MKKHGFIVTAAAVFSLLAAASGASVSAHAEGSAQRNTWFTDANGRIYYYGEDGEAVTGTQEIDGEVYLFSKNGVLKTGWRTVDGKRRYYDPETGEPQYGWIEYCGRRYYIADDGKLTEQALLDEDDGKTYLLGEFGSEIRDEGFVQFDELRYYVDEDGTAATGEVTVDGKDYMFGSDGVQLTGWQNADEGVFYYDPETGESVTGLIDVDGNTYYVTDEGMQTGLVTIDGSKYYFSTETGQMVTGLYEIAEGDTRYFGTDGRMQSGWLVFDDGTRYFSAYDGKMYVGKQLINGNRYFFDPNGIMLTGRLIIDGDKYYFDESGALQTGFITFSDGTYYFDNSGVMHTGWVTVSGSKYYLGTYGVLQTGWMTVNGSRYYAGSDGKIYTGLKNVGDNVYYFGEDGKVCTGRLIIDGSKYYFNESGIMQTGWVTLDDGKYYFNSDGKMATGWQTIGGVKYHFNTTSGKMDTNMMLDGYNIKADGSAVAFSQAQKNAQSVLSSTGTGLSAIYNWVRSHNNYKYIEATKSLATINSYGWQYFANYAFNNRYVVCYYFAAVTDCLMKQAGYTTRIVYGTGRGAGDHYWNQVLIDGTWWNIDTCNGYYYVTFSYLQSQNYTFYQFVYPVYY